MKVPVKVPTKLPANVVVPETVKLPDEGSFNVFQANAAFSDTDGNYEDAIARGVRETDLNNKSY